MASNPEIIRKIEEIRQDKIHGASWLSRQAIGVLNLLMKKSEAKDLSHFLEELEAVGRELIETKPSMASITNCVSRFIYEVSQESEVKNDLNSLKKIACSKGSRLIKDSEDAFLKTTERGAELIENGNRLMTCSYSSTICQALRLAKLASKGFHVSVAESKSGDKAYGVVTAEQLKSYGILTEIIPDNATKVHISKVDIVLVGADSILFDGTLTNGTPTYSIAMAARGSQVPFYSLCETAKFDVRSYLGQPVELEEGFDRVPPHLITGIITEEGTIKPSEAINYSKKMEEYTKVLLRK